MWTLWQLMMEALSVWAIDFFPSKYVLINVLERENLTTASWLTGIFWVGREAYYLYYLKKKKTDGYAKVFLISFPTLLLA